ncbi:MAG: hypothetical protein U5K27_02840 [Desulfotignum sp.]|nr:hypothetical protein [Desulfotignum sp.]
MKKTRIGIVIKNQEDAQIKAAELLKTFGDRAVIIDSKQIVDALLPDDLICILVLGGDGTFSVPARLIGDGYIPCWEPSSGKWVFWPSPWKTTYMRR